MHFLEMKRVGNNQAIMMNPSDISTSQLFFGAFKTFQASQKPIDMGTLMLIVEVQSHIQVIRLENLKFTCCGVTYDNRPFDSLSFCGINSLHIHSIFFLWLSTRL